ncbi:MAG: glycerate kinase [Cyanobacteria bacterium J06623_7]
MDKEDISSQRWNSLVREGRKSVFFAELQAEVERFCQTLGIAEQRAIADNLADLWLPTALYLVDRRNQLERPLIQGILGSQGTGKTTLCLILQQILGYLGYGAATLSIDDLYLTYRQRLDLQQQDPRLIWRGPPGTHDVALGIEVIESCLQPESTQKILLPRFDKSAFNGAGDRTKAESVVPPDILLFEGWFVGVQPLVEYPTDFPSPIITAAERQFAWDNNARLQAYLPLWARLDSLIVLYPEDYRLSQQWRKEAEQKMIARGKTGMSDDECDRFVAYFWQTLHPELYIKPLIQTADLVIEIKGDRSMNLQFNQSN